MKINEKNLCIFATTPPYDLEGFLNKRGEVNKAWQKRYFVLKGNLLFYFERKGDRDPLGLIIVEGCTIELSEECDQFTFQIAFNGNRTYLLSAETQETMEIWMKALTCAGYEYKKLMVAELQRQLEEIDECQKKRLNEPKNIATRTPIPPPRRQNPFNKPEPRSELRPAPPPPVVALNSLDSAVVSNDARCEAASRTTAVAVGRSSSSGTETMNLPSSTFYGNFTPSAIGNGRVTSSSSQPITVTSTPSAADGQIVPNSFKISHEAYRKMVYEDFNKYWESKQEPLIEI